MSQFDFNVAGLEEVHFAAGDTVMAENTSSKRVYLLKSGSVTVSSDASEICKISQPLSIFGEIGALLECAHSATVIANIDSTFYVIKDLRAYCCKNPEVSIHLAEILAQRLMNMNRYFIEFKSELKTLDGLGQEPAFAKRVNGLILRMDRFWGQEIVATRPRN